ncbi:hypothetical protein L2E82_02018 [Cichorium intybus]|uniref:Uncharacterized protein n=1 Tax=Cichorium intybus TaxID=13427 RepID=A0ACB9H106_CICIN|nr:hypothetical protein L2E82_02018 [Cichorium intybus]
MAYTESSRAKVRSVSAPRQRGHVEFSGGLKRYSVYRYGLNPGRLDRLGMPVGGLGYRESEISGGYWNYQYRPTTIAGGFYESGLYNLYSSVEINLEIHSNLQ